MRFRQFSLGFLAQQITYLCAIFAIVGYFRLLPHSWKYDPIAVALLSVPIGAFVGNFWGHSQRFAFAFGAIALVVTVLLVWALS